MLRVIQTENWGATLSWRAMRLESTAASDAASAERSRHRRRACRVDAEVLDRVGAAGLQQKIAETQAGEIAMPVVGELLVVLGYIRATTGGGTTDEGHRPVTAGWPVRAAE